MQLSIQHDPEASRFHVPPELLVDDNAPVEQERMANMGMVLSYRELDGGVVDFRSTLVPAHLRGRGLGSEMVRKALDWARAQGHRVVPSCPFVKDFLDKNPEYQDLIADRAPLA
jgi:uncharacterized protein